MVTDQAVVFELGEHGSIIAFKDDEGQEDTDKAKCVCVGWLPHS